MEQGNYVGTHYWWDAEDREYTICATWYFERGYPEIPDSWHLREIEIEEIDPDDLGNEEPDVSEGSFLWKYVEDDGPPSDLELRDEYI